jgi:hypothetical protein
MMHTEALKAAVKATNAALELARAVEVLGPARVAETLRAVTEATIMKVVEVPMITVTVDQDTRIVVTIEIVAAGTKAATTEGITEGIVDAAQARQIADYDQP